MLIDANLGSFDEVRTSAVARRSRTGAASKRFEE